MNSFEASTPRVHIERREFEHDPSKVKVVFANAPKPANVIVVGIRKLPPMFLTPEQAAKLREKKLPKPDHEIRTVDLSGYTRRQARGVIEQYRENSDRHFLLEDPEYQHSEPRTLPFPLAAIERWLDARTNASIEADDQAQIARAKFEASRCEY